MSLQVFLQAQLFGAEEFLATQSAGERDVTADFIGRGAWLTLICEILPRALLADLKLSRMLLGSSSAEQFLLVLAEEDIARANEFLNRAAEAIAQLSAGTLRLFWASTENLGAWPVVRKRLDDALLAKISAPLAQETDPLRIFEPFTLKAERQSESYFEAFARDLQSAARVGWSTDSPAHLVWDDGQYSWQLKEQSGLDDEGIAFLRRFAMNDEGTQPTPVAELADRAEGLPKWGILRGDVDHFDVHLRRVNSIEEHIHLSVMFKEFFAGELALLCTLPDFWRKVSVLYRGGDDFTVLGSWDALVLLARELERLFEKFIKQNAQSLPDLDGRTISMALEIASDESATVSAVFQSAGAQLRAAKSTDAGSFHLFGRTLEWKRLNDAEELKTSLIRLARESGFASDYIHDLASVYREAFSARASRRGKAIGADKPWRTYMRLSRVIPQMRGKELSNLRNTVIANLSGRRMAGLKLRPSARVGLEWARLAAGHYGIENGRSGAERK